MAAPQYVKVIGKPKLLGTQYTADIEVANSHSYQIYAESDISATPVKLVSSNSVSLLAGSTPGVHYPQSKYYIRRIRMMRGDILVDILKQAGFKVEDCIGSEKTTVVAEFPIGIDENVESEKDVPMYRKLLLASFMQKYWSDNQVSVTVTFDPKTEGDEIVHALNYFQYDLKSVSFLPSFESTTAFPQMPYEAISEETYKAERAKINMDVLYDAIRAGIKKYGVETETDRFCSNDSCMIGEPSSSNDAKK